MVRAFVSSMGLFGRSAFAATAVAALVWVAATAPAFARGPEAVADVAEQVVDAVVNISTSQKIDTRRRTMPRLPPGSPFEEFFEEFFKNRRGQGDDGGTRPPLRQNSLGSGFIIDPSGFVVTNNHVIADADEITVILNDGTKLNAEVVGHDKKTDLALMKITSTTDKPLKAVKFGDSDKLRLGEWVIAIGNPFSLGGSVSAGIVSARNREIGGPYDDYIQTDAAINKGNSGGPLFNLEGEVIGINTAIYSPSGGSVGIGFAVPSKIALAVIDQLRQYGETRRGWLGVRIQPVTEDIADSLSIKPPRGALVAGIADDGPAKPAGIETGDVIVKFDGKDIKDVRELQRVVADTPVGKDVDVVVIRKGNEETKRVKLGRLEDGEKKELAAAKPDTPPDAPKSVVKRTLGLELADLDENQRKRYKIKDTIKGVVVTSVDPASNAAEKRLSPGDVITEVGQEPVQSPDEIQERIEKLKAEGRRTALFLVVNADGQARFVSLSLQ